MADRARMRCRSTGCTELVTEKYCPKHLHNNPRSAKRADEWYQGTDWTKFSLWLRMRNAQCQKLINGVRCQKLSQLVHHLVSPRVNMALLLEPTNCVCLCRSCHPITEGSPEWREGVDYVATEFSVSV